MFDSLSVPVVFAHRGASAHAPENTLAAVKLAVSQGAKAIELDVQLSADREVVVFHDRSVARTTNGIGNIDQLTYKQIRALRANADFQSDFPNERIPTLKEVLSDLNSNIFLNIELKNAHSPFDSLPFNVANIIEDFNAESRIMYSSFNPIALSRAHRFSPKVPRGLLVHKPIRLTLLLLFPHLLSGYQSINVSSACVTEKRVAALHKLGKKVFTYTLNTPEDILDSLKSGVDGFFTDDPALGLRTLTDNGYNSN